MKIEKYIPANSLKPFIQTFMIIESADGMENRILPDTSMTIAFTYKGMITYEEQGIKNNLPSSVISGIRKSSRVLSYSPGTSNLLIVFKAGGASVFFNQPFYELYGLSLSLDTFIATTKLNEIEDRLSEAKNDLQRISIIEQFLLSRLCEPKFDLLVLDAIQKIKLTNGDIRIKKLIADLHISQDSFEKRFRRLTGTSPKKFSSFVRLRKVIEKHSSNERLTDSAFTAGYFDQAHFIRDFKTFTGQTPRDFFKSSSYW